MQTGIGGGGGGGGGAFPFRSPHQQGGNQPFHHKKSQRKKSKLRGMVVELDVADADRGLLIGRSGATVKAMQALTGARISIPKASTAGPVVLSAAEAESVLHSCLLIAQSGRVCASGAVTARMRPSQGMPALEGSVFRVASDNPVLFTENRQDGMRVLALSCPLRHVESFDGVVDDAKFAAASHAEVIIASEELLFVYGSQKDKVEELHATLQTLLPAASSSVLPTSGVVPEEQTEDAAAAIRGSADAPSHDCQLSGTRT